ncbi:unnamed protein product [Arctia plantaginis]|uniref:Uncharacterized protein n=1 Tax=Arctia plantaginis TaxID=874455 RepID=A0A8S0Z4W8_ARCPL|nr:unnamed protein product [Arctia plantaginis]
MSDVSDIIANNSAQKENLTLRAAVAQLQTEISVCSQNYLRNELKILGILETPNRSLGYIALLAARKIGVELSNNDIDWIERVGSKRPPPEINQSKPEQKLP